MAQMIQQNGSSVLSDVNVWQNALEDGYKWISEAICRILWGYFDINFVMF